MSEFVTAMDMLNNPLDCVKCAEHYYNSPHIVEAAASVGIERGKSTSQMLRAYLAGFHKRGHPKDRISGGDDK